MAPVCLKRTVRVLRNTAASVLAALGFAGIAAGIYLAFELNGLVSSLRTDFASADFLLVVGVFFPVSLGITQVALAAVLCLRPPNRE